MRGRPNNFEALLTTLLEVGLALLFSLGLGLYGLFIAVRLLFKSSMLWAPPLTQYLLVLAAFCGGALAVAKAQNLRIDFLRVWVERRSAQILANSAGAVVSFGIAGLFAEHMRLNLATNATSDVLSLPVWVTDLPFLLVFLSMGLLHVVRALRPTQKP